jgi:hypothetical protein
MNTLNIAENWMKNKDKNDAEIYGKINFNSGKIKEIKENIDKVIQGEHVINLIVLNINHA